MAEALKRSKELEAKLQGDAEATASPAQLDPVHLARLQAFLAE
jgi:hypothetical protein